MRMQVERVVEAFNREAAHPPAPQYIGRATEWVDELDTIDSAIAVRRSDSDKDLSDCKTMCTRLLLCLHHTLIALDKVATQGPHPQRHCFTPVELRHLARTFSSCLPIYALSRAGALVSHPNSLCAPAPSACHGMTFVME